MDYAGQTHYVHTSDSGWTSLDFTDPFKTRIATGDTTAYFSGSNIRVYDGVGYVFTSAEEGHPAFLEVTTNSTAVPLPGSLILLGSGLIGLVIRRKTNG